MVGYLDTLLVSVAILVSIVSSIIVRQTGSKGLAMLFGAAGFMTEAAAMLFLGSEQLESSEWLLTIYVCHGANHALLFILERVSNYVDRQI